MTAQQQFTFAARILLAIELRKINRRRLIEQRHKARACA